MKKVCEIGNLFLIWLCGVFLASYFEIRSRYVIAIPLMLILLVCLKYIKTYSDMSKSVQLILGIFSGMLSFVIVLGKHIHVERAYAGKIEENYITSFTVADLIAFLFILAGIYIIVKALYLYLNRCKQTENCLPDITNKVSGKQVIGIMGILFLLWLPYLITYYPGYVFGDTQVSIGQIMGYAPLNNHHPIFYTLFIGLCFKIGSIFGGNTAGCVCYCIIQILYMAGCLSYISCWLYRRFHLKKGYLAFFVIVYGCIPYFAEMSIAMWKDPIFAVTLALLTVLLIDYVLYYEKMGKAQKFFWFKYIVLLLITNFIRNNGIYIVFFMAVMAFVLSIWISHRNVRVSLRKLGVVTMLIVIITQIIVGPIYDKAGIIKEKAESYGIFLNQMARVVVYDGAMTEDDKEYMNQLLPLDMYREVYTPCCVDNLKWNPNFNAEALNNDFFKHYFSMLIKNPKLYFEAWELQTYGFWTVTRDEINNYNNNILGGVPRNYYPDRFESELATFQITPGKYVNNEILTKIFPIDDIGVPIGMIAWAVLFLVIVLWFRKQEKLLIALTPSVGLLLTLIIASPINYWPRYGAAVQYLIPVYIALFICKEEKKKENVNG